jgi:ribosomal protein S18 acetylase RimI-like enzyme
MYIALSILCTSPEYQRRGLGKALMEPLLRAADAKGLPTWLEASPMGVGLYQKLDFETVETLQFVLSDNYLMPCMMRKPRLAGKGFNGEP